MVSTTHRMGVRRIILNNRSGFWDTDYVYFNREGYDKHGKNNLKFLGGYYDDNYQYVPGEGWDAINQCYKNEIDACAYFEDDVEGKYINDLL